MSYGRCSFAVFCSEALMFILESQRILINGKQHSESTACLNVSGRLLCFCLELLNAVIICCCLVIFVDCLQLQNLLYFANARLDSNYWCCVTQMEQRLRESSVLYSLCLSFEHSLSFGFTFQFIFHIILSLSVPNEL